MTPSLLASFADAQAANAVSSEFVTAMFSGMAAVIGAVSALFGARSHYQRKQREREESIRREIEGKVKAEIPQPCTIEQSSEQAKWKDNAHDHENIFCRLSALEQKTSCHGAEIGALKDMNDRMFNMLTAIYERIVGKKTK